MIFVTCFVICIRLTALLHAECVQQGLVDGAGDRQVVIAIESGDCILRGQVEGAIHRSAIVSRTRQGFLDCGHG